MQPILDRIDNMIRPALRNFAEADASFVAAQQAQIGVDAARQEVMLAARQAAMELHHLSDFVLNNPSHPLVFRTLEQIRGALAQHCIFLREPKAPPVDDVRLLHDVADAFKHHKLDRKNATVNGAEAVVMTGAGWDDLKWGEGKWDGVEQVIVKRKSGEKRVLSSVLQNVFDAWMKLLGQPLPEINEF